MRPLALLRAWVGLSCCALASCADRSDIALTATLTEAAGSVVPGVFGSTLSGDFTLVLQVGAHASGKSTVTLETFSLNSEGGESLVSPLDFKPLEVSFPLSISPGGTAKATFHVGPTQLTPAQALRGCEGHVLYAGAITDSLAANRVSEVRGHPFLLACAE